jgi:hypothetical protein
MRLIFLTIAALLITPVAEASTPSAWAALDVAARGACGKAIVHLASKAKVTRYTGKVSGIVGDRYYALIASGTTARSPSQWLCLYDKRTKLVEAHEVEN